MFNAHWLTYFDDACTRFFGWLGFDPKQTFSEGGAIDMMLVKAVVEWQGSAGFDDPVDIDVVPARIGNSSFDLRYTARVGERPVCEGLITYVSVPHGEKRSVPIRDDVRAKLEAARDEAV